MMTLSMMAVGIAVFAAPQGQLAFLSGTAPDDLCVTMLDLETGTVQPIGPGKRDGAPRWTPDGQWLAFETATDRGLGIFAVRVDGTEGRVVSQAAAENRAPRWAPDSRRLAYAADNEEDFKTRILVADLDTGKESAWGGENAPPLMRPVWLPSTLLMKALDPEQKLNQAGEELAALASEAEETGAVMAIGIVPGQGKLRLSTEPMLVTRTRCAPLLPLLSDDSARYAEWAIEPDRKGERIAYESTEGGDREIYVIGKRGIVNVTNHFAADWNPVWAPDAKRLAIESFRDGRRGVYTVFNDTAKVAPVDASPEYDAWAPAWAPDSEWLAYVNTSTGDPEIFLCRFDGTESRRLTTHPGPDYAPAWRPKTEK